LKRLKSVGINDDGKKERKHKEQERGREAGDEKYLMRKKYWKEKGRQNIDLDYFIIPSKNTKLIFAQGLFYPKNHDMKVFLSLSHLPFLSDRPPFPYYTLTHLMISHPASKFALPHFVIGRDQKKKFFFNLQFFLFFLHCQGKFLLKKKTKMSIPCRGC
jgi:hypothetical protein